jgi:hypothetical protein
MFDLLELQVHVLRARCDGRRGTDPAQKADRIAPIGTKYESTARASWLRLSAGLPGIYKRSVAAGAKSYYYTLAVCAIVADDVR